MMIIEHGNTNKRIVKNTLIDKPHIDVGSLDMLKLRSIAKKSHKIFSLTRERNSICDKRLDFEIGKLNKNEHLFNLKWSQQYFSMENVHDRINQKTRKNDMINSKLIKNENGDLIFSSNCDEIESEKPTLEDEKHTGLVDIFTSNRETEANNECKFSINANKCKFYPCSRINSYTSIIGPHNDRRIKTAPSRLQDESSPTPSTPKAKTGNEIFKDDFNFAKSEYELSKIELDNFSKKISLRRSLRVINSFDDLNTRIEGIETRVKYCKEKNFITLKPADRNIRYGAELPRKGIYRELRVLN